jgi:hypothetical protein
MPLTPRHPMLSSERIRARFGSYGVDVLECDERHRVSSLYSLSAGERTCRSFAQVRFSLPVDPALTAEHARVIAGESIGAVFQSAGWRITRRHLQVAETPLSPAELDIARLMRIACGARLATHTYVFHAVKDGRSVDYAHITERHHPAYLTAADLRAIYGLEAKQRVAGEDRFTT